MATVFCRACGAPLTDTAVFCAKCGAKQPEAPPAASQPVPLPEARQPASGPEAAQTKKRSPVPVIVLSVLLALCLLVIGYFAYDKYFSTGAETTAAATEEPSAALALGNAEPGSPLTLEDLCFSVNGVVYQYPFRPDDFTAERGWTVMQGDAPEQPCPGHDGFTLVYVNGDILVGFQYYNDTEGTLPLKECFLEGVAVWNKNEDDETPLSADVSFARGITGASTVSDLRAAFGSPHFDEGDFLIYYADRAHPEQLVDISRFGMGEVTGAPLCFGVNEQGRLYAVIFGFIGGAAKADPEPTSAAEPHTY